MRNIYAIFSIGLYLFGWNPATAQTKVRLVRSPVPFWPPDVEAANKAGVYFDSKLNQIVIKAEQNPGSQILKEIRYDVANGTSPRVAFSATRTASGKISYSYSLVDDTVTPQVTLRLSLLLPASDASRTVGNSAWAAETSPTTIPDRTNALPLATMQFLGWTHPGKPVRGAASLMQLESSYLPGFIDAFAEGDVPTPVTHAALATLPADLADQAARFMEPGVGSSGILVLGPLFRPDLPKSAIATNFHYGFERLMGSGAINPESAYAKAALAALDAFLQNGAIGRPQTIQPKPVTSFEQQLDSAMTLAFQ
jgi:hypothetical protein